MINAAMLHLMLVGILETLYMTVVSTLLAYAFGLPLGVVLYSTDKDGILPNRMVNGILGILINLLRSIPFIILLIAIIPITRAIVGTIIGSTATIVPLVFASTPFVARMVESSIKEVDGGVIEAAQSMGSSPFQVVYKVLLPEAKPSLITGSAIAITTILGYAAMAGFTGGGGLGAIAINYGYYRYKTNVMLVTLLFQVIIVQVFQEVGMKMARVTDKRIR